MFHERRCVSYCFRGSAALLDQEGHCGRVWHNSSPDSPSQHQNQRKTEEDNRCSCAAGEEQLQALIWTLAEENIRRYYYQKRKARLAPAASPEREKDLHSQSTRCLGQSAQGHFDTKHNLFFLSVTVEVPCSGLDGPIFCYF